MLIVLYLEVEFGYTHMKLCMHGCICVSLCTTIMYVCLYNVHVCTCAHVHDFVCINFNYNFPYMFLFCFFLSIIFLAFVYSKGYTIAIKSNNYG